MAKYRLILASLVGCAFTGSIALSLNLDSPLVLFLSLFLFPGSLLTTVLSQPGLGFGPPLAVMLANSLFYSAVAYAALTRWGTADLSRMKSAIWSSILPALALACLAAVPSLNPLWPKGMQKLEEQEQTFRNGLAIGSSLDSARTFLRAQKVDFFELDSRGREVLLQDANTKIVSEPGDHGITARIETDAEQFPCGYRIQLVLVFGQDQRLRERYVKRMPICP